MKWKYKNQVILISGILFLIAGPLIFSDYHDWSISLSIILMGIGRTMITYFVLDYNDNTTDGSTHGELGFFYIPIIGDICLSLLFIVWISFKFANFLYKDIPECGNTKEK